ncbi:hypothetical protein KC361_g8317 [Hortaea werneckii]|nr:hypothetical protein KC361_g8317 [Hortaea werneckii]
MLSRSNSTAGDRLRRAKSTSSHHTTSSGHQRSSTSIGPFVTRQHAEVAALEAYNRARREGEPVLQTYPQVPPKIKRRRSQAGRREGSHLEEARLGRRRSTPTKRETRPLQTVIAAPSRRSEPVTDNSGDERVITKKRSVIPPNRRSGEAVGQSQFLAVPAGAPPTRKVQSVYTDGSPTPRHSSARPRDRHSSLQRSSTPTATDYGYNGNLDSLSNFGEPLDSTIRTFSSARPSIRKTQTDEEILALARDKCLRDFQQKKPRERKSMLLAPFQRRRTSLWQQSSDDGYDHELPPFNYAGNDTLPPLPPMPPPPPPPPPPQVPTTESAVPTLAGKAEKKSRMFSDTLKGRIKKAFRKTSRTTSEIPVQHIEARQLHYPADPASYQSSKAPDKDPFADFDETLPLPPKFRAGSGSSKESLAQCSDAKSRVTSWTNSTVAGTVNSRISQRPMTTDSSSRALPRSGSQATLRKASSFFGRPVINKLRKTSMAQLKSNEESTGLYTALQERIKPSKRPITPSISIDAVQSESATVIDGRASLPSQQRGRVAASRSSAHSIRSIRTVTPDPTDVKLNICSPVPEVASPDGVEQSSSNIDETNSNAAFQFPSSDLQRRHARKAMPPSSEQLARRMEKSKNRWQCSLDEFSPAAPRSTQAAMMDDNPYELRSLSRSHPQPPLTNDLPHHTKIEQTAEPKRPKILSPSLYSRATDGASPRPFTPVEPVGTVVTITGREVRSYSISPPKKDAEEPQAPKAARTSGQWRKWLSDEMHSFKNGLEGLTLTQALTQGQEPAAKGIVSPTRQSEETGSRPGSVSPLFGGRRASASASRPQSVTTNRGRRTGSRTSSMMNERYPMIETGRQSREQSLTSRNTSRQGFRTASRASNSPPEEVTHQSGDGHGQRLSFTQQRVVTGRQSLCQLNPIARGRDALNSLGAAQEPMMSGAIPAGDENANRLTKIISHSEGPHRVANKHRSALELRANYTNTSTGRTTPLEIRRKNIIHTSNMLEDSTIMDIAAGPYASHQAPLPSGRNIEDEKENAPPASADDNRLPALSSSEWLAAGPSKSRKSSAVHPALRNRSVSRYSPVRNTAPGKGSPASPGQRLAGEWLEKRSRETTPAFM